MSDALDVVRKMSEVYAVPLNDLWLDADAARRSRRGVLRVRREAAGSSFGGGGGSRSRFGSVTSETEGVWCVAVWMRGA